MNQSNSYHAPGASNDPDQYGPERRAQASVLEVANLHTVFKTRHQTTHAVNGVSFHIKPGELLGVVGESGSGKSVTMMSFMKLLAAPPAEITAGSAMLEGRDLFTMKEDELRDVRGGEIGFIFQDPMTSLNPVFSIGFQLMEPLRIHKGMSRRAARKRAAELLELVGIPSPADRLKDFPHQFSGGMRQRVVIAMALACDPKVLIADEPTTALDVTIQAQIIELIKNLRQQLGMAIIWITHDLGVVAGIADRVLVMYGGQIVEQAAVKELFANPQHPYTSMLLETLPNIKGDRNTRLQTIAGQPPVLHKPPDACVFGPRCPQRFNRCDSSNPALMDITESHSAACWLHDAAEPIQR